MGMYSDIRIGVSESVIIMGYPFYAENITSNEPFNRREREFTPILGGTERISKGKYIHREYSFNTTVFFPTDRPHAYDNIFKKMMSEPVKVFSNYMGGEFKALIGITIDFPENSPNHMDLEITVTEVPDKKSLIKGESSFKVPSVKKISTKNKITTKKTSSKSKTKKSKSKRKISKKKNK